MCNIISIPDDFQPLVYLTGIMKEEIYQEILLKSAEEQWNRTVIQAVSWMLGVVSTVQSVCSVYLHLYLLISCGHTHYQPWTDATVRILVKEKHLTVPVESGVRVSCPDTSSTSSQSDKFSSLNKQETLQCNVDIVVATLSDTC